MENTLVRTGGPPELRRLLRDTLIKIYGHDFGLKMSVHRHRAFFSLIAEMGRDSPLVGRILSYVDLYYKGLADDIELSGFISLGEEVFGTVRNRLAHSNAITISSSAELVSHGTRRVNKPVDRYVLVVMALLFTCLFSMRFRLGSGLTFDSVKREKLLEVPGTKPNRIVAKLDLFTPLWTEKQIADFIPSIPGMRFQMFQKQDDNIASAVTKNLKHNTVVFYSSDRIELRIGNESANSPRYRAFETNLVGFTNYFLDAIDPAYMWNSVEKLSVVVSNPQDMDTEQNIKLGIQDGVYGFYQFDTRDVWVRNDPNQSSLNVIRVLIHEIAHRVHLDAYDVATECEGRGFCVNYSYDTYKRHTDISRVNVYNRVNEAKAVLYLGLPSENMTPDEARIYLKAHLDTRIRQAYHNATHGIHQEAYAQFEGATYALSSYWEFWAEASVSYLLGLNVFFGLQTAFPHHDWIKENDPQLYVILEEVYSGMRFDDMEFAMLMNL